MKRISTLLFLLLIGKSIDAQNLDWAFNFGHSGGYSSCGGVAIDAQSNVYSVGTLDGTMDMDPGAGVSNLTATGGMYIQKLSATGNFLWAKSISSTNYVGGTNCIITDASGNLYVIVQYSGNVDFDPGPGVTTHSVSPSSNSAVLLKLDAAGNYVYSKEYNSGFRPSGMKIAGNFVYLSGFFFAGSVDFDVNAGTSFHSSPNGGGFIQKLDLSWNLIWTRAFNNMVSGIYTDVDANGNVFATGPLVGSLDLDPGPGTSQITADTSLSGTIPDIFLLKLNSSGNHVWSKKTGSPGSEFSTALTVDRNTNDFYIAGNRNSATDFDPSPATATLTGTAYGYIAKYDAGGSFIRVLGTLQMSGGYTPMAHLNCDIAGNLIVVGACLSAFDADPGPGTVTLTPLGPQDIFLQKLDADGHYVWSGSVGSSTVTYVPHSIDGDGNIYYGGQMQGTVDLDPFAGSSFVPIQGVRDAFISKISGCAHNAPDICLVTVDSLANNNVIYWNKSLYPSADSFIVYRYDALTTNYLRIGAGAASDTNNFLVDTARTVGGPNGGDPQYSSYRYKMAIRDICGTIGTKGLYHESIFIQQNFQNFSWNAYGIEGQSSPASGYQFLRNNTGSGTWQVLVNTGGLSTTDPNYASYPSGKWRVDALGFSCTTGVARMINGVMQTMGAINTSRSNIKSPTSVGLQELQQAIPVKVYPNPASDLLSIEFPSMADETHIEMTNVLGELIYSRQTRQLKNTIDCSSMKSGVYFITISSARGRAIRKVVIE